VVVGAKPQPPHIRFSSPGKGLFHHPARAACGGREGGRVESSLGGFPLAPRLYTAAKSLEGHHAQMQEVRAL